ncbi:MAG: hypothetical protein IPO72_02015 [Saprospiraceae bacterium]|nr:hypothetical protein [Candidatus Vicinibacter affinis]MBK7303228.1 hypothetical protein [Candidatus Vicinibacter affinis]MBK7694843.1 hypothetical protein [Candidatus Vicinibacter affinis]MBK9640082.1 hypothetical protein [Candidatus Vicinibacter affinis]HQX44237.1 hypothetical protein [Saprospiraceae bacterium]
MEINKKLIIAINIITILNFVFQFSCTQKQPNELITYHEKGNVEKRYTLKEGKKEGLCEVYYASGKLKGKLFFENDQQTGKTEYYYPSGKIKEVQYYEKGKRINWDSTYHENGAFQLISKYENGKIQGDQFRFDTSNQLTDHAVFNQDTLVKFIPLIEKK